MRHVQLGGLREPADERGDVRQLVVIEHERSLVIPHNLQQVQPRQLPVWIGHDVFEVVAAPQ